MNVPGKKNRDDSQFKLACKIAVAVKTAAGRALVVGGYPRDTVLAKEGFDIKPKDIDLEVFGLSADRLFKLLSEFGRVNEVGASFAVFKLSDLDVSLPRRDSKTGAGHRDFRVETDPDLGFAEASRRRDFTINSLALDPLTGEMLDAHGGMSDIKNRILRATDYKLFGDDPLRVLRAMQLAARFDFKIEEKTMEVCRDLDLLPLSRERIGEEWRKLLLKSPRPSIGLSASYDLLVIKKLHPEVEAMVGVPQSPKWHPEGDVWTHTLLVLDATANIIRREKLDEKRALILLLTALVHDLGKPPTTKIWPEGRITSYGHAKAGLAPAKKFLESLALSEEITRPVLSLVREHMYPAFNKDVSAAAIRRLAVRLQPATIEDLVWASEADRRGRAPSLEFDFPEGRALLLRAKLLEVEDRAPKPIVMGRHLLKEGIPPGLRLGVILARLFEAQLEGSFSDLPGGLEYFRDHLSHL
ncbi:MAG: HD domain-containing protein [Patescibacteria group bacterium]